VKLDPLQAVSSLGCDTTRDRGSLGRFDYERPTARATLISC
jgi:hypothetical protein